MILAGDRIGHVQSRRDVAREQLAIVDAHRSVRALRHNLHRHAVQAGDLDAHQLVAEIGGDRLDDMGDAGLQPGLAGDAACIHSTFSPAPVW